MPSPDTKQHPLQAIGIFFAGLGILIAAIAFLIWVLRSPLASCPAEKVSSSVTPRTLDAAEIQKFISEHKDLKKIINDSEFHKSLKDFGKETSKPLKKVKTETKPVQP